VEESGRGLFLEGLRKATKVFSQSWPRFEPVTSRLQLTTYSVVGVELMRLLHIAMVGILHGALIILSQTNPSAPESPKWYLLPRLPANILYASGSRPIGKGEI
jgi:hypothetical protein